MDPSRRIRCDTGTRRPAAGGGICGDPGGRRPPAFAACRLPSPPAARRCGRRCGCRRRRGCGRPAVMMPVRFSGSAALIVIRRLVRPGAADLAQPLDRVRQRELLARHAGHESAAADLAARLEPAIDARELAPGHAVDSASADGGRPRRSAQSSVQASVFDRGLASRRRVSPVAERTHATGPVDPPRSPRRGAGSGDDPAIAAQAGEAIGATSPAATSSPSASRTSASVQVARGGSSCANDAPRACAGDRATLSGVARGLPRRSSVAGARQRSARHTRRPRARGGTARSAWRRPPASARSTAAPSRPRRSGTACRASPARSARAARAARRAPTRAPAARGHRAARSPRAGRRARRADSPARRAATRRGTA